MNRGVGRAAEQPLKPPIGTSAHCGSKEAARRNGTTGGPVLFRIPRGKQRVFWRRPVRLEVFGPDGAHEHLERWTFAPSGMNRSRPYGRKLLRPPLPRVGLSRTERDPGRSPISVEGMPRCISSTLKGISGRRQILRMCPPKNPTPTSRMGTLGTLPQPDRCPFGGWFGTD
jgi:hypothetical protein